MYASLFEMSGALHLDVFEQPEEKVFFSNPRCSSGKAFPDSCGQQSGVNGQQKA